MRFSQYAITLAIIIVAISCNRQGCTDSRADNFDSGAQVDDGTCDYSSERDRLYSEFKTQFANIAFATYSDVYDQTLVLQGEVENFLEFPTEQNYQFCKDAWLIASELYGTSVVFPYTIGGADEELLSRVDGWPIIPSYIDYADGDDSLGIINQETSYPNIDAATLEAAHNNSEGKLALGFHAIEFLLWGEDRSDTATDKTGNRVYRDYLSEDGKHENQDRRGDYLLVAAQRLTADMETMKNDWDPNQAGNLRNDFLNLSGPVAARNVLNGLYEVSNVQLAQFQFAEAIANPDSLLEQSEFSDNTLQDLFANAIAMENAYMGTYITFDAERLSGTSVNDVLLLQHDTIAARLETGFPDILLKMEEIIGPFDRRASREGSAETGSIAAVRKRCELVGEYLQLGTEVLAD